MKLILLIIFCPLIIVTANAQVGIGTTDPDQSSVLDISATDKGLLIPRISLSSVTTSQLDGVNTAETSLLIWNTNPSIIGGSGVGFYYYDGSFWRTLSVGDITAITAGAGLTGGGTSGSVTLVAAANNGLYVDAPADRIKLGGNLIEDTTLSNGAFNLNLNLSGTGDFNVQDNGTTHFQVRDNGNSYFGGEIVITEDTVAGTTTARLFNIANQDGALWLYRNGSPQHRLDAGFGTIFNQQQGDFDFVIRGETRSEVLGINADEDIMFAGRREVTLTNAGATVNGIEVEYVASFYRFGEQGTTTNGTAINIGTTEYLMDIGNLRLGVYGSWIPYSDNTFDLGTSTFRWDDVYATSGIVNTSDIRLKKNIKNLSYGLNEVMKLEPISYQWKDSRNPSEVKIGFSAQQLLTVLPEVVKTHDFVYPDENGPAVLQENENLGVYYSDIIPVLTKAIQEQQQIIEDLKKRIEAIENKN